jgi:hypothetical protein
MNANTKQAVRVRNRASLVVTGNNWTASVDSNGAYRTTTISKFTSEQYLPLNDRLDNTDDVLVNLASINAGLYWIRSHSRGRHSVDIYVPHAVRPRILKLARLDMSHLEGNTLACVLGVRFRQAAAHPAFSSFAYYTTDQWEAKVMREHEVTLAEVFDEPVSVSEAKQEPAPLENFVPITDPEIHDLVVDVPLFDEPVDEPVIDEPEQPKASETIAQLVVQAVTRGLSFEQAIQQVIAQTLGKQAA